MTRARLPLAALIAANAISLTGNVLASVAIPWFVLETTGSAALTGVAAFAATAPFAIGSLFAGRIVDALGLRRASIVSDVVSGVTIAGIPLLHALGQLDLAPLLGLTFAGALLDAVGQASRQALVPTLAKRAGTTLERANGLFDGTEHIGYLIGAPLAGILIVLISAPGVLWLDAASFAVAAGLLAFLVHESGARTAAEAGERPDLRSAFRVVWSDPVLRGNALYAFLGTVLINPLGPVVLPVYASTVAQSPLALGASVAAYGIGGLFGTAAFAWLGRRLPRSPIYIGFWIAVAALFALLVPLPPLLPLLVLVFVLGFAFGLAVPVVHIVRQERTPPHLLPRVIGLINAARWVSGPIAVLAAGVSIQALGLGTTLAIATAGWVPLAIAVALDPASRRLAESRKTVPAEAAGPAGGR